MTERTSLSTLCQTSANMRRLLWLCFLLLASWSRGVEAQQTVAVAPGSKIRVQSQGSPKWRVGRLTSIAPDTVRLQSCVACSVDVYSLQSLSAIQVSVGRTRRSSAIARGALFGALIGLGSGWLYGWQHTRGCSSEAAFCGIDYIAVPFFGAGGFFIGAAIGSSIQYDDWRPALIR
jgi:hypothetical protein